MNDGDPDIRFNPDTERLEVDERGDPPGRALDLPQPTVLSRGASHAAPERDPIRNGGAEAGEELLRLNRVAEISETSIPVQTLVGFDYGEVTEVFVRVKSKGMQVLLLPTRQGKCPCRRERVVLVGPR